MCVGPADGICPGRAAAAGINNKATRCDYMAYWSVAETVVQRQPCVLIYLTANRWRTSLGEKECRAEFKLQQNEDLLEWRRLCHRGERSAACPSKAHYSTEGKNVSDSRSTFRPLTAIKVRTLRNVAVGSENQLHVLDNALEGEGR